MKKLLKFFYSFIPFKKKLFDGIKTIYIPSRKYYQHLHFKGEFKVKLEEGNYFKMNHLGYVLENEIYWNGLENGWEKYSIDIWKKLVLKSNTIFDIGANTGVFALIAKQLNPESNVFAFEPISRVYERLVENTSLNKFEIHCRELALSDKDGSAMIYDPGDEHVYSVSVNKNLEEKGKKVYETQIEIARLDTFIFENEISNIDLLKIDVEQHEPQVLIGYGELLAKHKPSMLIEIMSDDIAISVQAILKGLGYLYFNIDEEKGIKQMNEIVRSSSFNILVCQPETAEYLGLIKN